MTYYVYDVDGYIGDAASTGGYGDFIAAATDLGGEISFLCENGYSDHPKKLARELKSHKFKNRSAESVRSNLEALARKAKGVFIISDGIS